MFLIGRCECGALWFLVDAPVEWPRKPRPGAVVTNSHSDEPHYVIEREAGDVARCVPCGAAIQLPPPNEKWLARARRRAEKEKQAGE